MPFHDFASRASYIARVIDERQVKGSLVNAIRGNESHTHVPRSAKICEPSRACRYAVSK